MLAATYSVFQTIISLVIISAVEFGLFFGLVWYATRKNVKELFNSFYKTYLEALIFVLIAVGLLLVLKFKVGFQDSSNLIILFEQMYALMLLLSLVLTCSMHYEQFAQKKYQYAFVGLMCLLVFLLLYNF